MDDMDSARQKMPSLFVGHGSPINAIEDNDYTRNWVNIACEFPKPKAILAISAHWYTNGSRISDELHPKTVYDIYGFPDELYKVQYNAIGAPELARLVKSKIGRDVRIDNSWGIDHGTWSVLYKMYPEADIPVFQLSVDYNANAEEHFRIGKEISTLRNQGVLVFGSGNVVHNLAKVNWEMNHGYPWADEFDGTIKNQIIQRKYQDIIHYEKAGISSELAFVTPDHFYPLLYILGASTDDDKLTVFNDSCTLGSMSMTSYLFS